MTENQDSDLYSRHHLVLTSSDIDDARASLSKKPSALPDSESMDWADQLADYVAHKVTLTEVPRLTEELQQAKAYILALEQRLLALENANNSSEQQKKDMDSYFHELQTTIPELAGKIERLSEDCKLHAQNTNVALQDHLQKLIVLGQQRVKKRHFWDP